MNDTNAPFARVLEFYERHRYMKLQHEDLIKVFEKYSQQPEKILIDLKKKYNLPISSTVPICQVVRLLEIYSVPVKYSEQTWKQIKTEVVGGQTAATFIKTGSTTDQGVDSDFLRASQGGGGEGIEDVGGPREDAYNAALDINSQTFNANLALQSGKIIAPYAMPPLDNTFRFTAIIERGVSQPVVHVPNRTLIDKAKAMMSTLRDAHAFDIIAESSVHERAKKGETRVEYEEMEKSPLSLLGDLMRSKTRAQIIIRRKSGIKGIMLGFVQAFDRHTNILLSDALEAYVPNGKRVSELIS